MRKMGVLWSWPIEIIMEMEMTMTTMVVVVVMMMMIISRKYINVERSCNISTVHVEGKSQTDTGNFN